MFTTKRRRSVAGPSDLSHLGKPHGTLSPRVRAVGPEHFGIVSVDCAKASSKWMLTDVYGRILIAPSFLDHRRDAFDHANDQIRQAVTTYRLGDLVVVVERTGRYHLPVKRAFEAAGWTVRVLHPMISSHFRQAAHPDDKTDDHDLVGIFQATCNGYGLVEPSWDPIYSQLQVWARHRRDLVNKSTQLACQIQEHLESCLPGYGRCFDNLFESGIALVIPGAYSTPQAIVAAGLQGLSDLADRRSVRVQRLDLDPHSGLGRGCSSARSRGCLARADPGDAHP